MKGAHSPILEQIEARTPQPRRALKCSAQSRSSMGSCGASRLAAQVAERRSIDDATRARVMAMGELLATTLGCANS